MEIGIVLSVIPLHLHAGMNSVATVEFLALLEMVGRLDEKGECHSAGQDAKISDWVVAFRRASSPGLPRISALLTSPQVARSSPSIVC